MRNTGLHLKDVGVQLVCDELSWTEGMPLHSNLLKQYNFKLEKYSFNHPYYIFMFKLLFIWMSFFHLEQLQSYFFPSYNSNILHRQHFHFASVQVRSLLLNSHPQSDPLQKGNSRWDCEMLQSLFGSSPTPASPVCQLHASTVFYEEYSLEET